MKYLDFHCDTLKLAFEQKRETILEFPEATVDFLRLRQGGAGAQFFAAFVPPREHKDWWKAHMPLPGQEAVHKEACKDSEDGAFVKEDAFAQKDDFAGEDAYILAVRRILEETQKRSLGEMELVRTASQMRKAMEADRLAAFFTLEDGRSVNGSMEKLKYYYDMGVSLITLTWNYENCFGFPNSREASIMEQGLKPFGKEAVEYMNELGMAVDVSHLSDGGFWDVAHISKKPFVASHSNCRALSPHPRNLTDEMLRALAEKGGVAGLNFCSAFLGSNTMSRESYLKDMVAQICHMVQIGGLSVAAIGTDFDGIESRLEVEDPTRMELLFDGLQKAGFSQDAVEQIAWKNGQRVLYEIMG